MKATSTKPFVRLAGIVERLRGSLWLLPALGTIGAIIAGTLLPRVGVPEESALDAVLFPGGPDGAQAMLQAVATSVITVTTLVFTLTVVALQLASTQFSPRLLRTFLRLPANQFVLSTFIATFVYCLVVLRWVRVAQPVFLPRLAVSVAFLLVLLSVAALVFFLSHITTEIRISTLMWRVEHDTLETVDRVHPEPYVADTAAAQLPSRPIHAVPLPSQGSGIVQAVAAESLRRIGHEHGVMLVLACRVGDRLVREGTVAWTWSPDGTFRAESLGPLTDAVAEAVTIGYERTMQQDISYGVRQLTDVAVKAMSPGVNDPTTAVDAVGHLTAVLTVLARRRLEPLVVTEDDAVGFALDRPSFDDYLGMAVSQIRRYGAREPDVLLALLDLCREVTETALDPQQVSAVREQVRLIVAAGRRSLEEPKDVERVEDAADVVLAIADGGRPPQVAAVRGDT